MLPDLPDFPSRVLAAAGRAYRVTADTELAAFHVEAALPHAPDGFIVYVWLGKRGRVGNWNWTADPAALERIMSAYRTVTDRGYVPPPWTGPDGAPPDIRPPIRDLVQRAIDDGRPDFREQPAPFPAIRLVEDEP